jgi:integrase
MGQNLKSLKGEINIENNAGRIRLRWRYQGERYQLSLPYDYCTENIHHANVKVAEIKLDILKGSFDSTLQRYRPVIKEIVTVPLVQAETTNPSVITIGSLVNEYIDWTKNIRNINIDLSFDYLCTKRLLERWGNIPIEDVAAKMSMENWKPPTYNRKLNKLFHFFTWLKDRGVITLNPLLHVNTRKYNKSIKCPTRIPLTEDEIIQVLDAIKNNTHCPKASTFKHSHYYPFLYFLFHTGVRNAEAVGLKVKHINLESYSIEISETLARTPRGSHHAARISKSTKTGNVRYLPLTDNLKAVLIPMIENKGPEELVFKSPTGVSINDRMLQKRTFKPVLKKLGIQERDLYSARAAFGTRAVQQGMPLTDVAYLMGHSSVETAIRNYVSVARPAVNLPTINKKGN